MIVDIHDDGHHYTWRSRNGWSEDQLIRIYVESEKDAAFYTRLTGPTLGRWIQFLRPPGHNIPKNGGGYYAWKAMMEVRSEPDGGELANGLYKAYCLIDGEEIARARTTEVTSAWDPIVRSGRSIIKDVDHTWHSTIPDVDGALFLNCYEFENLYLLHTDILDVMWGHWGTAQKYFGEETPIKDSWKILQRTLIISELKKFAKYYNVAHGVFDRCIGELSNPGNPGEALVKDAIHALKNPPAQHVPRTYRAPLATVRAAAVDLKARVEAIQNGGPEILSFDRSLLAECDGKVFCKLVMRQRPNWESYFQNQLIANGFAAYFQMSLVMALENVWVPRGLLFAARYPQPADYRPAPRYGYGFTYEPPGYEYTVGRGRYALTARRRSWRNAPPIEPERPEHRRFY